MNALWRFSHIRDELYILSLNTQTHLIDSREVGLCIYLIRNTAHHLNASKVRVMAEEWIHFPITHYETADQEPVRPVRSIAYTLTINN